MSELVTCFNVNKQAGRMEQYADFQRDINRLIAAVERLESPISRGSDKIGTLEDQQLTTLYFIFSGEWPTEDDISQRRPWFIPNAAFNVPARLGLINSVQNNNPRLYRYPINLIIPSYRDFSLDSFQPGVRGGGTVVTKQNGIDIHMHNAFAECMVNKAFKVRSMELILPALWMYDVASQFGAQHITGGASNLTIAPATWHVQHSNAAGDFAGIGGVFTAPYFNAPVVPGAGLAQYQYQSGYNGLKTDCNFIWGADTSMFINFLSDSDPCVPTHVANSPVRMCALKMTIENKFLSNTAFKLNHY